MDQQSTAAASGEPITGQTTTTRFLILAQARTGSTMLVRALNSHPNVRCFGEVLNTARDLILYGVQGYDNYDPRDRELRDRDFKAFLRTRIYTPDGEGISATGFKLLYGQFRDFPGLQDWLTQETSIRVIHLKRRNLLRQLVSLKLAFTTGVWVDNRRSKLSLANLAKAVRHPPRAAAWLGRRLRPPRPAQQATSRLVAVSAEELFDFIVRSNVRAARYDDLFSHHNVLTLFYEDMVERRDDVFAQAQEFLGVKPAPLTIDTRKQNPQPLAELIANYEELRLAFKDTEQAAFFD